MPPLSKKLLLALAELVILNIGLSWLSTGTGISLTGEAAPAHSLALLLTTTFVYGICLQLPAMLLGSTVALVPYRGWPYPDRVLLCSTATALAGHLLLLGLAVSEQLGWM